MGRRVQHVARAAPPWARQPHSECGKLIDDVPLLSHQELFDKITEQGQVQASMTTCMTCWGKIINDVGRSWLAYRGTWATNPAGVLGRYMGISSDFASPKTDAMQDDLRALAELVARHQDEFDELRAVDEVEAARRAKAEQEAEQARRRRLQERWR